MSLFKVFDVAGTGMNAQSVRMNVTASNLANAGSVNGDPDKVYRASGSAIAEVVIDAFGNRPMASSVHSSRSKSKLTSRSVLARL